MPGCPANRLVHVFALEHVVATDDLVRLGKRPICQEHFTVANPHGGGIAARSQSSTVEIDSGRYCLREPLANLRGQLLPGLVVELELLGPAWISMNCISVSKRFLVCGQLDGNVLSA
jgi:hypothetical protein